MICNICGAQEATIHLTEIINYQMMEVHLCEICAKEKGTDFKTHFNLSDLLTGLTEIGKPSKLGEKKLVGKCPTCGMTYDEFGKSGRLGCADCYQAFAKMLSVLIKRVQRSSQHTGKRPSKIPQPQVREKEKVKEKEKEPSPANDLKLLQERLRKSIQNEAFEEAAKIRDEIKQLEEKTKKTRKPS